MGKAVRVAISLPHELLRVAERKRKARRQTRSEFFRCAVERMLREEQERERVEQYVQGYAAYPETDEEIREAGVLTRKVLDSEPWQ